MLSYVNVIFVESLNNSLAYQPNTKTKV